MKAPRLERLGAILAMSSATTLHLGHKTGLDSKGKTHTHTHTLNIVHDVWVEVETMPSNRHHIWHIQIQDANQSTR